jgi:hypothetical protein
VGATYSYERVHGGTESKLSMRKQNEYRNLDTVEVSSSSLGGPTTPHKQTQDLGSKSPPLKRPTVGPRPGETGPLQGPTGTGRVDRITRADLLLLIALYEHNFPEGNLALHAFRMLLRSMDALGDLIYGEEDFKAAEELLAAFDPEARYDARS